jgi:saccharopine dehydrogenase-like NADP-dependent oxidoreductase
MNSNKTSHKVVILGGAGSMGRITLRDLLETTSRKEKWEFWIADLSFEKAQSLALDLKDSRVHAARIDIKDRRSAVQALAGTSILINSTSHHLNLDAMELALDLRCHYIDLGGLFHMTRKQLGLHERFARIGKLALLGMGAAPGITNLLAKKAADTLDTVTEIHTRVASYDQTRYEPKPTLAVAYSIQTILEEFSLEPAIFTDGDWTFGKPMSGDIPMRFPSPIGIRRPMHTLHSEVATLPTSFANKGVRECTFKIAFDPEFTDRIRFLRDLGMASQEKIHFSDGSKVSPIEMTNRVVMSLPQPKMKGPLKQHEVVRAVVKGTQKGKRVTLIEDLHTKGMPEWGIGLDIDTGSPPAIAAQMLAAGEIISTGALPAELCVPVSPFFKHLRKRKMTTKSERKSGWSLKT